MNRDNEEWLDRRQRQEALLLGALCRGRLGQRRRARGFNNLDDEYFDSSLTRVRRGRGRRAVCQHSHDRLRLGRSTRSTCTTSSRVRDSVAHGPHRPRAARRRRSRSGSGSPAAAFKRVFLQSLFTGDGSSSLLPRNTIQISYSTTATSSRRMFSSSCSSSASSRKLCRYAKGETKVVITNRRDARLFALDVGFLGAKQAKLERDLATIPRTSAALSQRPRPVRRRLHPQRLRLALGRQGLAAPPQRRPGRALGAAAAPRSWSGSLPRRFAQSSSRSSAATTTTPRSRASSDAGVQPVYSLRVDTDDHSFLTNGFVSHNTEARLRGSRQRCCATSTRTPSTSSRTTTSRAGSRRCCRRASRTCSSTARRHRGRHGDEHAAAPSRRDRSTRSSR